MAPGFQTFQSVLGIERPGEDQSAQRTDDLSIDQVGGMQAFGPTSRRALPSLSKAATAADASRTITSGRR